MASTVRLRLEVRPTKTGQAKVAIKIAQRVPVRTLTIEKTKTFRIGNIKLRARLGTKTIIVQPRKNLTKSKLYTTQEQLETLLTLILTQANKVEHVKLVQNQVA